MKIVKLASDRVRVFISESDLFKMHIDISGLTPNSPELNAFLGEILAEVKKETGFSLTDGRVLAEATPEEKGIILDFSHIPEGQRQTQEIVKPIKKESVVFEFLGFETLVEMLKNVSGQSLLNMRLYSSKGKFYLAVPKRRVPAIIYEYSLKNSKSNIAESKLMEYGRFIAGGYRLMSMKAMLKKIN